MELLYTNLVEAKFIHYNRVDYFTAHALFPLLCEQVPQPHWYVSGWRCGHACFHGLRLGRRKQGRDQELQEEEPHAFYHRCDGCQLLCAVPVRRGPGVHLWNHFPPAL